MLLGKICQYSILVDLVSGGQTKLQDNTTFGVALNLQRCMFVMTDDDDLHSF